MVLARRLTRLEASLDPESAAIRWLDEAQASWSTLAEHLRAMAEGPWDEHPLTAIPRQLKGATREARRGHSHQRVAEAARRAIHAAVFRIHLVLAIDDEADSLIHHEGLRHAALMLWLREMTIRESLAEEGVADDLASVGSLPGSWAGWDAGCREMLVGLQAARDARARLEARFLAGHESLFVDRVRAWDETVGRAEGLHELADSWEKNVGRHADMPLWRMAEIEPEAETRAGQTADRLVDEAAYITHIFMGETGEAHALARRALADHV
jgi:hypothetical protein